MQTIRNVAAFVMLALLLIFSARAEEAASASEAVASSVPASAAADAEPASASASAAAAVTAAPADVPLMQNNPASPPPADGIVWQTGPHSIDLLDQASIKLPADYAYLASEQAQKMLRTMGNPNVEDVAGLVAGPGGDWFVVLRFQKSGYIKDGDAKDWNTDTLLELLKKGTSRTNAMRHKAGNPEMEVVGWVEKPRYDTALHRLVWAVSAKNKGDKAADTQGVNYNTFALGRDGYISLNLISDLKKIDKNKRHLSTLLSGLDFKDGKNYADFDAAKDKVAPYGLTTLVSGMKPGKLAFLEPIGSFFAKHAMAFLLTILGIAVVGGLGFGARFYLRKRRAAAPKVEPSDAQPPEEKKKP